VKIGFIGLGSMGREIATRLQGAGHELVVHDIRPEAATAFVTAGGRLAADPAEVMREADVVFTSLPEPAVVEAVALGARGLIESAQPGKAYFDLSTNSVTTVRELYRRFALEGVAVCDAPVSGGPAGAAAGKLSIYVGGDEPAFEAHRGLFDTFGDNVTYVGAIGAGTIAKLMHQCAGFIVNAAIAEVFTVGVRAGVEPLALWRALRSGAVGRRRTFDGMENQFLPHDFDRTTFTLTLAHKDARLATEVGREFDVPMRLSQLAFDDMCEGLERGWAARSSFVTMLLQEERAGVHVEVPVEVLRKVLEAE
jgi:3-hydroxyisobutyrate dehydrogenase-like beta-hydroxyacid dehydrogenase